MMLRNIVRTALAKLISVDGPYGRIYFGIAAGKMAYTGSQSAIRTRLGLAEWQLVKYVRRFSYKAKVAYDIGSNEGYYVLAFCRMMGKDGRVYAFEADHQCVDQLHGVLIENNLTGRVEVVEGFVGDIDKGSTVTIDGIIRHRHFPAPDVVKIDVEGAELQVLRGMEQTIVAACPKLIIEVHSQQLENDCIQFLSKYGYEIKIVKVGLLGRLIPEVRFLPHNRWIVGENTTA